MKVQWGFYRMPLTDSVPESYMLPNEPDTTPCKCGNEVRETQWVECAECGKAFCPRCIRELEVSDDRRQP